LEHHVVTEQGKHSKWGAFLRLWLVMAFSFVLIKILFNLLVLGWVDIRPAAFQELLLLPLGQSVVFWFVTRRSRSSPPPAA